MYYLAPQIINWIMDIAPPHRDMPRDDNLRAFRERSPETPTRSIPSRPNSVSGRMSASNAGRMARKCTGLVNMLLIIMLLVSVTLQPHGSPELNINEFAKIIKTQLEGRGNRGGATARNIIAAAGWGGGEPRLEQLADEFLEALDGARNQTRR